MTSQSPRIYTYKITFEEVPYYYYGVHKEKYFNEEYFGSPYTNKWCWELYTPKKQILQLFDFTDEGWLEANLVEDKLIKPFYQTDKCCLNESCGGMISLNIRQTTGKKVGLQHKENGTGIFSRTALQHSEDSRKSGLKHKENKTGIFALTPEQRSENGKIYGKISGKLIYEMGIGIHNLTPEQRTANGKKGGAISGKNNKDNKIGIFSRTALQHSQDSRKGGLYHKENKTGIFALTYEEQSERGKKNASQRWECLETGFISGPGPLTRYQNYRGIDTSKRRRIS